MSGALSLPPHTHTLLAQGLCFPAGPALKHPLCISRTRFNPEVLGLTQWRRLTWADLGVLLWGLFKIVVTIWKQFKGLGQQAQDYAVLDGGP